VSSTSRYALADGEEGEGARARLGRRSSARDPVGDIFVIVAWAGCIVWTGFCTLGVFVGGFAVAFAIDRIVTRQQCMAG
jgi:hypothetical protein